MKDRFSAQASKYAAFRPTYPQSLYDFIFGQLQYFDAAWDAGTGNGQVAVDLARKFKKVFATDISQKQLDNATGNDRIIYSLAGEGPGFSDNSFDLITVGQAIHWFDREKFYQEVRRVGKKDSLLAVWGYGLLGINAEIDPQLKHFYTKVVGPHWDPERKLIDDHYQTMAFPFNEIKTPSFEFSFEWSLAEFRGYLSTWSSVQKYIAANGNNPVTDFISAIEPLWGTGSRRICFPLFLRLGRIRQLAD